MLDVQTLMEIVHFVLSFPVNKMLDVQMLMEIVHFVYNVETT